MKLRDRKIATAIVALAASSREYISYAAIAPSCDGLPTLILRRDCDRLKERHPMQNNRDPFPQPQPDRPNPARTRPSAVDARSGAIYPRRSGGTLGSANLAASQSPGSADRGAVP